MTKDYPFTGKDKKHPFKGQVGTCRCPMWMGGLPAGHCDNAAYGEYIDGPKWRDGYTGELIRHDMKPIRTFYGPACPNHGGPTEDGPRVFTDGYCEETGRQMYCAVLPDFTNIQESPCGFDYRPWVAIEKLRKAVEAEDSK
ncbi:hypothetical protein [Thalassospira povalilytica]|uniref:hypothetical protein n=1 Tax=Thalassospira povalilytica TaxID=732237 RepID=UPI001D1881C3|nr:hypothetical protein [Thalassospira povalilytica]MCC4240343.1 hypothetical protein [Thalassospira povalilytica]